MSPIRLVVSDVDGTLVTRDKRLTPGVIAAVHRLHTRGIAFTAVSSRPPFGMRMLSAPLKIALPMGAFNGSTLFNPDGSILENHTIPPDAVDAALDLLNERGVEIWLFTAERWLVRRGDTPYVARERHTIDFEPEVVGNDALPRDGICKIVGVSDDFDLLAKCEPDLKATLGKAAHAARSQNYYLDVTPPALDKGTFVESVANRLGIPLKEVAVIGDMANDLPMFLKAGMSFAMANASDAVKKRATYTTSSNEEDGVASAIDRILALV
ncbi:HAD family hydrolase [[Pseudomonas] carboxydohydrogena]|uniref:HAD family hydrolase n=1 Tax=Afipia carboxydohydrogena TaxID=290 RepID=A0ABY8BQP2_AFICR|nr:HAD family hydrolase [[Pseudomonas] carboxydohydrogena]WEF52327.1 HAD family hydrolase [[Pseudomonas] carboxydohydrogena]